MGPKVSRPFVSTSWQAGRVPSHKKSCLCRDQPRSLWSHLLPLPRNPSWVRELQIKFAPQHMTPSSHTSLLESCGLHIPTRSSQGHLVTCRVMETAHVGTTMQQTRRLKIPLIPCRNSHGTASLWQSCSFPRARHCVTRALGQTIPVPFHEYFCPGPTIF